MKKILLFIFLFPFYLFSQGVWTQKANFGGFARMYATGFSVNTKGYIGTGDVSGFAGTIDFWEWDQTTNTWTQKANFAGGARWGAVGFSIGQKGYLGLGWNSTAPFLEFWEWDQATNIWTKKADFPGTGRVSAVSFSIGTKGYVGTGSNRSLPPGPLTNDFWEWDQTIDAWTQKANFQNRNSAVGFSIGAKGYIGIGYDGSYRNDFWEWDQSANTWTQKANFGGVARESAAGFSIGTKGFIGTGSTNSATFYNDFWEWNQSTNIWSQKSNFGGIAREIATGFSIGTKGYIGTGNDGTIFHNDFWEYCDTCSAVGITESEFENSIFLSPNPATNQITINSTQYTKGEIEIFDAVGKVVFKSSILNLKSQIDVSFLEKGIYFLHVRPLSASGLGAVKKFMKM